MSRVLMISLAAILVLGCSGESDTDPSAGESAAPAKLEAHHPDAPEPTIEIEPSTTVDQLIANYKKAFNAGATGTILNELVYWGEEPVDKRMREYNKAMLCIHAGDWQAGESEFIDAMNYMDGKNFYGDRDERYAIESPDLIKITINHPTISARTWVETPFGRVGDRYYFGALLDDDITD